MKERPILFNSEMVRAVLDGRKTQTRRVVKPQPEPHHWEGFKSYKLEVYKSAPASGVFQFRHSFAEGGVSNMEHEPAMSCPYGVPGDRLWVRETWGAGCRPCPRYGDREGIEYRADEAYIDEIENLPLCSDCVPEGVCLEKYMGKGWRPSIHMPRWASRILLEVVSVRVERVAEISERDAMGEGCGYQILEGIMPGNRFDEGPYRSYRHGFMRLWDSINAKRGYGWDVNPWCWVVEFKQT